MQIERNCRNYWSGIQWMKKVSKIRIHNRKIKFCNPAPAFPSSEYSGSPDEHPLAAWRSRLRNGRRYAHAWGVQNILRSLISRCSLRRVSIAKWEIDKFMLTRDVHHLVATASIFNGSGYVVSCIDDSFQIAQEPATEKSRRRRFFFLFVWCLLFSVSCSF